MTTHGRSIATASYPPPGVGKYWMTVLRLLWLPEDAHGRYNRHWHVAPGDDPPRCTAGSKYNRSTSVHYASPLTSEVEMPSCGNSPRFDGPFDGMRSIPTFHPGDHLGKG